MKSLRLGTRKSALAQAQAAWVAKRLKMNFPDLQVEIVLITTSGDLLQTQPSPYPLPKGRGPTAVGLLPTGEGGRRPDEGSFKALFTKEIEEALLDNRIDLAVHSLKDMAAELPKDLMIGAVPEREDPRDAWISKNNTPFQKAPQGSVVGTGAVRRTAQLKRVRPDFKIAPLRGNVDTRLKKLQEQKLDGIVLALAGLKRLGLEDKATEILSTEVMLPAVGQGCLAIEVLEKNSVLRPYLKALDHAPSHAAALAERALLKGLGGSCQTPIAGYAELEDSQMVLRGLVISPDGVHIASGKECGRQFDATGVGERLAQKLIEAGADKILAL